MEGCSLAVGAFTELFNFGILIGDIEIALVACRLYRDALAPSTKVTYKTGVRHFKKFKQKYPMAPIPSKEFNPPSLVSISLTFFAAYLIELDSIKIYATIRNYMTHVKQFYIKKGFPKKTLESNLLKSILRGIKKMHPSKS